MKNYNRADARREARPALAPHAYPLFAGACVHWVYTTLLTGLFAMCFAGAASATEQTQNALTAPIAVTQGTPNTTCLSCHGIEGFAVPVENNNTRTMRPLSFDAAVFSKSIHGKVRCVSCHTDIAQIPHPKGVQHVVHCTQCHQQQAEQLNTGTAKGVDKSVMGLVEQKTNDYLGSIHAQPNKTNPARPNAACVDCHRPAHFIAPIHSKQGFEFRDSIPAICGRCHPQPLEKYQQSVHSASSMRLAHDKAAVCSDCHTAHRVSSHASRAKLVITKHCGGVTKPNIPLSRNLSRTVRELGYAYIANALIVMAHSITCGRSTLK